MKDISKLRLVKIDEPSLIPRYLIDQVKGLPYTSEDFYEYYGFYQGPFCFLYAVLDRDDQENPVKGVIWICVDPMSHALRMSLISIHKDYQFSKFLQEIAFPKGLEIGRALKIKKGYWATTRPKAFEKMGFTRSNLVIMEAYDGEQLTDSNENV